jgi:hypothetical protein
MKKITAILIMIFISFGTVYSQYDMRTNAGKAASKRDKKANAALGAVNMATSLSDKKERAKAKESLKKNSVKVKESFKDNYNKVKDGWKNRKK